MDMLARKGKTIPKITLNCSKNGIINIPALKKFKSHIPLTPALNISVLINLSQNYRAAEIREELQRD